MNPAYTPNAPAPARAVSLASRDDCGASQVCAPPTAREVERTLTELRHAISALESSLDVHAAQLQPALSNAIPTKAGCCGDKEAVNAPLAQVIDECAARVRRITDSIQDLTSRVQV